MFGHHGRRGRYFQAAMAEAMARREFAERCGDDGDGDFRGDPRGERRGEGRGHRGFGGRGGGRGGMGRGPFGDGFGAGFGGGFGPGGPRRGRGRPGKALEQGDLRWLALDLIAEEPRHGYDIIKAIEEALSGHYAPSPGAVYPLLTMLEETGLIEAEAQGAKKLYRLTDAGGAEVVANADQIAAAKARLSEARERFGGAPAPELMRALGNLRAAVQVRMAKGDLTGDALAAVTAAIDRAAGEIERA